MVMQIELVVVILLLLLPTPGDMALRMRQVLARTWVGLLDFFFLFFFR